MTSLPPPLDMPPMDEEMMEDLGFLDAQLVDPEMLRASMSSGAGGAVGAVVWSLAVTKIKDKADQPLINTALRRGGLALALGLVGGRALWGAPGARTRDMAKGLMGAMGGIIGVEVVTALTTKKTALSGINFSGFGQDEEETEAALASFGQSLPEEQALLNGMGQVDVEQISRQRPYIDGMDQVDVEEGRATPGIGSWIGY